MTPLRILLVEDDANIREVLAETLEGLGYAVCGTAATQAEAIAIASRCKPDLMIVDIGLGSGNGVSAVTEILLSGHVPHLFMSGLPDYLASGLTILRKPFTVANLVLSIEAAFAIPRSSAGLPGRSRVANDT